MTRIRRDHSSPHYNQFQRYTTKEHRNSILKLRCKSKRRGPALLGRMSDSEPFDGTRATGGATDENTNERALTAAGFHDNLSPNQKNVRKNRPIAGQTTKNETVRRKRFRWYIIENRISAN